MIPCHRNRPISTDAELQTLWVKVCFMFAKIDARPTLLPRQTLNGRTDVCRCCASFSSFAGAAFTAKGHLTPIMHLSLTERGWERKKMGTAQQMELASMAQSVMSSLDRSMSAAIANASSSREGKYTVCGLTGTYHIVCRMRYQTK